MKHSYLLIFLAFSLSQLFSEKLLAQHRVKGIVTDHTTGQTIIGTNILEKGTSNGTISDLDGSYELTVASSEAVLEFSFTGFASQEIPIAGRATVDVVMSEAITLLNQIVVVGYGTQRKSDLTGAVGSVKTKDIERIPTANIEQALQGKIAGVYVAPSSGVPGAGAVIRIRGTGTLNNANPLFVIDGMITYDASFVNPQDVASVEVLKDASAAAIYGSRGSNGVIIITTKSGVKRDHAVISLTSYYGTQQVTKQISMANATEFATLYNELRGQSYFPDPAALGEGTNWQNEIFRSAPIGNVQLSANGGTEMFSYNFSANYFAQDGIIKNSNFERTTLRLNLEYKLNSWLTLGNNISYANVGTQNSPDVITSAYRMPPVFAPRDSTGDFTDPTFFGLAIANPAADLYYKSNNHGKGNRLFGNIYAQVNFLKDFSFRSNFGFDRKNSQGKYFEPKFEVSASQRNVQDRLSVSYSLGNDWIWEQTLNYNKDLGRHHISVLAGYTAEERASEYFGASRENFPGTADELLYLSAGNDTTQQNYGGAVDEALVSYLFRLNYTLMDRYLLTVSFRRDLSSRFKEANRDGNFPSFSVGWNLGQENFVQNMGLFDRLKLRFSYGILGNQASASAYPSSGVVTSGLYGVFGPNEALNQGAILTSLANPNLKWETSRQTDAGLEIGFFKNRLELETDWYNRYTYDIIAAVPIPDYVGSQSDPVVNTAAVRNRGWDFTANWRQSGKFVWNIGATVSPVKNEVIKLAQGRNEIFAAFIQGEPASHTEVGQPIGSFYGYKVAGIFQNEDELATLPKIGGEQVGDVRYADLNGDGVVDGDDRTNLGSPIPDLIYSFTAGFEWKGIDFAADFLGSQGNMVFNAKKTFRFSVYNWEKSFTKAWTEENPSDTEPRITNGGHNYRVSDRFLEDGSFFRLRSISIGYSLPIAMLEKAKISKLRVFAIGNNLWTKQDYSGYSPEFPNGGNPFEVGFDNGGYPVAKSWQAGIEVTF
ncbi:MAG: SusC/RagA family TonB-linked outer membrane protein [Bacteroidetes bacterium]|nr:SusC/RagA family TonB-linked outer membrane protein [Bacteroidota bacterium]